ncbi:hypothetical protein QKW51_08750 [Xenophilus aerolatus]|nr:hypothetical protein [Xenophilus aerolatus]
MFFTLVVAMQRELGALVLIGRIAHEAGGLDPAGERTPFTSSDLQTGRAIGMAFRGLGQRNVESCLRGHGAAEAFDIAQKLGVDVLWRLCRPVGPHGDRPAVAGVLLSAAAKHARRVPIHAEWCGVLNDAHDLPSRLM